jgi:plastocyanin
MLMLRSRLAALLLLAGCGAGDRSAPDPGDLVIAKPPTGSGDAQVGVAGKLLPQELRAVVTRDSVPVEGVTVSWSTSEGSLSDVTARTDAQGISTARWTLQPLFAQQVVVARLGDAGAPGVTFTAIATPDPEAPNTILVGAGGNRFEPAELTIAAGRTVNWFWPEGSEGHNIVPDDGDLPPPSGPPADYPSYQSFTFARPGVYHYHCSAHGGVAGAGMAGTITVVLRDPS